MKNVLIKKLSVLVAVALAIAVFGGVTAFTGEAVTYAASPDCCEVVAVSPSVVITASSAPGQDFN